MRFKPPSVIRQHWQVLTCVSLYCYLVEHISSVTPALFSLDGVEEVFAAVGESVSLFCSSASSLGVSGNVVWTVAEKPLSDGSSPKKTQSAVFSVNGNPSLLIRTVSALDAGDYRCSESTDEKKVFNKVRLHVLDGEDSHKTAPH